MSSYRPILSVLVALLFTYSSIALAVAKESPTNPTVQTEKTSSAL